jgi:hypothetical protein
MITVIFLSLLILVTCYHYKKSLSKIKRRVINAGAILMLIGAVYGLFSEETTDESFVLICNGISLDIRERHNHNNKILFVHPRLDQKSYWQPIIDRLGPTKVDEIITPDFVDAKEISEAIKNKGGKYDLLLFTCTPTSFSEPLKISSDQFDYVVSFSISFPNGMEDWYQQDRCVNYVINRPDPNPKEDAFASRVMIYDRKNYAAWLGEKKE